LTLTVVTGSHCDLKISDALKGLTEDNKPYVIAGAIVGLSGLMKIIYSAIVRITGRSFATFNDIEDPKHGLISQVE
jgi:hypothetical protein